MAEIIDRNVLQGELIEQRARLIERISEEERELTQGAGSNPERGEVALSYSDGDRSTAILARSRKLLAEVERALERLEDGSFGACVRCGHPIASGRLEAIPYAALCMDCQSQAA